MSFLIREAKETDAYDMASVLVRTWQSAYRGIIPDSYLAKLSIDDRAKRLLKEFDEYRDTSFYYVAELDGKIIGCMLLSKCREEGKSNAGEVIAMYLFKEFWDCGYGRNMMEHSLGVFRRMGFEEAVIWVLEENVRARRFYEKFGFTFDGSRIIQDRGKPVSVIRYSGSIGCRII